MASDLISMLKLILEAQQREMAWDPTSHHGFESSSTYQEGLPNGYSSQEYQYEYGDGYSTQEYQGEYGGYSSQEYQYGHGEGYMEHEQEYHEYQEYQSWNMEHEQKATYSSQISDKEEIFNMLKLALEKQEEFSESIKNWRTNFGGWSQDAQVVESTHVESIKIELTQWIDEEEEGTIEETFEDPCEDGSVVECIEITRESTTQNELSTIEEMQQHDSKQESYGETLMEEQEIIIEEASEENEKEESPMTQQFDKHLGILPTTPLSFRGPRKISFEVNAQIKDEFQQGAEESIKEFELLLGCTVGENLVIRYDEEEEVKPVAIKSYSTKSNEVKVDVVGKQFEDHCEGVFVVEYICDKHLGIISTNEVSIHEPRKTPFEEIRMNEFRGWFYDEYDPGDPSSTFTPTQTNIHRQA